MALNIEFKDLDESERDQIVDLLLLAHFDPKPSLNPLLNTHTIELQINRDNADRWFGLMRYITEHIK